LSGGRLMLRRLRLQTIEPLVDSLWPLPGVRADAPGEQAGYLAGGLLEHFPGVLHGLLGNLHPTQHAGDLLRSLIGGE